jgi:hypothetical protein
MAGRDELMAAFLSQTTANHPQTPSVALSVAARVSSFATRTTDDLGFGTKTVRNDVEVAFPALRPRGRRRKGFDHFGDLRQLGREGVLS